MKSVFHSFASIGDCFGARYLYPTSILSSSFDFGGFLAWSISHTYCVKAYKDGRLIMRKALRF